jgi:hypothetical protein
MAHLARRFAQDNRLAPPAALGSSCRIDSLALPSWADVWRTAFRAGSRTAIFRLLERRLRGSILENKGQLTTTR